MKKRAQIHIGETIAVLFVFFILVAIGFIFYFKIVKSNIEIESEEFSQIKSIGIAQRVMFLPELQCSEGNVIRENCIDVLKLESAQSVISQDINKLQYFDLFEFSEISVQQIYPNEQKWNLYSRRLDNFRSKFVTNVPVALFNPISRTYGFGILTIETMSK